MGHQLKGRATRQRLRFGRPATYSYSQRNLEERPDFANGLKAVIALRRDARKEQLHERLESACA